MQMAMKTSLGNNWKVYLQHRLHLSETKPKYTPKAKSNYTQKAGTESKPKPKSTLSAPVLYLIDEFKKVKGRKTTISRKCLV